VNLDERLEALTQNVELLAAMHRDNEKRFEERFELHEKLLERLSEQSERHSEQSERAFAQIGHNFEVVLDSIRSLENIARSHEQRLDDLEG
jgi:hypothetical protein